MTEEEIWKTVTGRAEGFPYEVSNLGRVRRSEPGKGTWVGRIMSPVSNRGYVQVKLSYKGRIQTFPVHSLVADAFLDPPPGLIGKKAGDWQVNHKNGNKNDCSVSNLEWKTKSENDAHAVQVGLTDRNYYPKDVVVSVWQLYYDDNLSCEEIAENLDVPTPTVYGIISGRTRRSITKKFGIPKVRSTSGSNNGNSKITEDDASVIRTLYFEEGMTQNEIAQGYPISRAQVGSIVRGEAW